MAETKSDMTEANFSLPHAQECAGFETRCFFATSSPETFTESYLFGAREPLRFTGLA